MERLKTRDFNMAEMAQMICWLTKQKLSNYGYEPKDFRKLQRYATKFRKMLKRNFSQIVQNEEVRKGGYLCDRIGIMNDEIEFTVGQSFNEEYINIMAQILERAGLYEYKEWIM